MSATTQNRAWVYIMASRGSGTLYIGVTTDLRTRIWQHRTGACEGFTKRYRVNRLVYFEPFHGISAAIDREKAIKGWTRQRKISLLEAANPAWVDLAAGWFDDHVDPSLRSG
jgi:putative endonuclease